MIGFSLIWVLAAALLGFAISAVFAGWLKFSRNRFLVPYVILVMIFLYSFTSNNQIELAAILVHNWVWGVLIGALLSVFLVRNVQSQPASRDMSGGKLALDITWPGLVYGLTDALFLNVMPVVAIWAGTSQYSWAENVFGKVGIAVIALLASLLVTLTYHLGYPEFRNTRVLKVLFGNALITLAFLISSNPLGSIVSHSVMHVAAVLHGPETTIQLPPHYQARLETN